MDSTRDRSRTGFTPLPTESQLLSTGSSYPQPGESKGFANRLNDFLLILVTLALFWTALDTYLMLQCDEFAPKGPVFDAGSSVLSNFTISDMRFAGTWDLGFVFKYNGVKDTAMVDGIEGRIGYDGVELSKSKAKPLTMRPEEQRTTHIRFVADESGRDWERVAEKMVNERNTGFLEFSLRVDVWITYKIGGKFRVGYLEPIPRTSCWNLVVRIREETGDGELISSETRSCPLLPFTIR